MLKYKARKITFFHFLHFAFLPNVTLTSISTWLYFILMNHWGLTCRRCPVNVYRWQCCQIQLLGLSLLISSGLQGFHSSFFNRCDRFRKNSSAAKRTSFYSGCNLKTQWYYYTFSEENFEAVFAVSEIQSKCSEKHLILRNPHPLTLLRIYPSKLLVLKNAVLLRNADYWPHSQRPWRICSRGV